MSPGFSRVRRSDFDVTDKIRTTDPIEVGDEVMRLYHNLYGRGKPRPMVRAFKDVSLYYHGKHPDYFPCDTEYHDIQHVLDVTLTMARLLDGYARARTGEPRLPPVIFTVGVVTALFHDFGYLRHRNDHKHRYGGEYTLRHVSRGSHFLRSYMPQIGLRYYADAASNVQAKQGLNLRRKCHDPGNNREYQDDYKKCSILLTSQNNPPGISCNLARSRNSL